MKSLSVVIIAAVTFPVFGYQLSSGKRSLDKIPSSRALHEYSHINTTPFDSIAPIPDLYAILGSPGRNIALRGDTIIVVSSPPSGDSDNPYQGIVTYYSFDGGHTFQDHTLDTSSLAFTYSGVEWPENWATPIFFWQETKKSGRSYSASKVYIAWDTSFPSGNFNEILLPHSEEWDSWLPSLDASGDTIVVTAVNVDSTYYSYLWKSYNRGGSWEKGVFLTEGSSHRYHDTPIIRIGGNGYIACITDWITTDYGWEAITPFFLESTDGGQSWSDPLNLWDAAGWSPYDSSGGWWYVYDLILDNENRPHIAWKFGVNDLEYGDCWYFTPTGGYPGNWTDWQMRLMAGEGDGTPRYTQPWISYDPGKEVLLYLYKGFFPYGNDTYPDIKILASVDGGSNWLEEGIWGSDSIEEEVFEIPAIFRSTGDGVKLHSIFTFQDYLYHSGPYPIGIEETVGKPLIFLDECSPNILRGDLLLKIGLPFAQPVEISLFDVSGRKTVSLYKGTLKGGQNKLTFPIDGIPSGIFIVYLFTYQGEFNKKVIILR